MGSALRGRFPLSPILALAAALGLLRHTSRERQAVVERQAVGGRNNVLAMVSHEFRMPLAVIDGAAQVLSLSTDGEAREELDKINRAVTRMTALMDTYLSEDRLCGGDLPFRPEAMDLHPLLAQACRTQSALNGRQVLFQDCAATCPITGDPELLRIVFDNLIGNAIKFSPPSTPVTVTLTCGGDEVSVSVADGGAGIRPADQRRIFEKYFRAAGDSGVQGAGLGLYIVRKSLDRHQGSVTVTSTPGHGATFVVRLPLVTDPEAVCPSGPGVRPPAG